MLNRESFQDNLTDVVVHMLHFDPLPQIHRAFILMTLYSHSPTPNMYIILK